jgi:hypothetical protein
LIQKIESLEVALRSPIKYNLMPAIKFDEFREAINKCGEEQLDVLFAIIGPYLDTLSARNSAIAPLTAPGRPFFSASNLP